jgi:cellulose synthase/poly-beta-1,6-N-acetylglucosamine synthase-like glycosyltransferase
MDPVKIRATMEVLLIGSIFFVFYSYLGYPISLYLLSAFKKKNVERKIQYPHVTMIVTAYNEEKRIKAKIENTLRLSYPKDKLQIVIASDGSTDDTNRIAESHRDSGIELFAIPIRGGKENAQKEALKIAGGEVIVFTDVATMLEPSGLERIVSNFADPSVGCVSSEDRLIGRDGKPSGEGIYVRYEMLLRRLESRVNSLVGLSGSFFAARKSVCRDFSGDMQSDFRTLLNSIRMGLRGVSDPEATGSYLDVSDSSREFDRKVRTVLRGLTVFFRHMEFLNVLKYGFFSYQYFCHKLLRWLVPFFLIIAFVANLLLASKSQGYFLLFAAQLSFYGVAIWGWKARRQGGNMIKIPFYFLTVNASIVIAWCRYLKRERVVMWTPSER